MPGVPTIYERAMNYAATAADSESPSDLGGVRYSISGAASLPSRIIDPWEARTGGMLVEGYGLTETSPVLTINPLDDTRRAGTIGLPLPDTQLRIGDPHDLSRTQPDGEAGELFCSNPYLFDGYVESDPSLLEERDATSSEAPTEEPAPEAPAPEPAVRAAGPPPVRPPGVARRGPEPAEEPQGPARGPAQRVRAPARRTRSWGPAAELPGRRAPAA